MVSTAINSGIYKISILTIGVAILMQLGTGLCCLRMREKAALNFVMHAHA